MGVSGGSLGFDEGGVLEALSKPFFEKTVTSYTYRKGQVATETVQTYSISMAHIVAAGILAGIISLGGGLADAIRENKDVLLWGSPFGALGILAAGGIKNWDVPGLPQMPPGGITGDDPFGIFGGAPPPV